MKDLLKKLAGLLVCLSLVSSLAACGGGGSSDSETTSDSEEVTETEKSNKNKDSDEPEDPEDPEETDKPEKTKKPEKTQKPTESDEELVEEVVTNFGEAYFSFDFKDALNYLSEDSELYSECESMKDIAADSALDTYFGTAVEELSSLGFPEESVEDISTALSGLINEALTKVSLEVDSVEINGDEAVAECTLTLPDLDSDILEDVFSEDLFSEEALIEMCGDEILELESEEEVLELVIPYVVELIEDVAESAADNIETSEESGSFTLNKIDGEWLIVSAAEMA